MEHVTEPLLFIAIAGADGNRQIFVKRAEQDLLVALDTQGEPVDPHAKAKPARPLALIRWAGSEFELKAIAPDGLHASGLLVTGGHSTSLGDGNTFKVESVTASTHIEQDTPAPTSAAEARSIALELQKRLPARPPAPDVQTWHPQPIDERGSDFSAPPIPPVQQSPGSGPGNRPAGPYSGSAPRHLEQPRISPFPLPPAPAPLPKSALKRINRARAPRVILDDDAGSPEVIPAEFDSLLKTEFGVHEDAVTNFADDALASPDPFGMGGAQHPASVDIPASRPGRALFRVPRTMWTETAELAELRLAASDPLPVAMRAAMERTMTGRGSRTDVHPVERVGRKMKAQLLGDPRYFSIEPLGSDEQDFGDGDRMGWDWRVVPLREGHSLLTLRMTMTADLQGEAISIDTQALHTSVEITVKSVLTRPIRFVRDNWKWMLGSSGIGAVAAIYALVSR